MGDKTLWLINAHKIRSSFVLHGADDWVKKKTICHWNWFSLTTVCTCILASIVEWRRRALFNFSNSNSLFAIVIYSFLISESIRNLNCAKIETVETDNPKELPQTHQRIKLGNEFTNDTTNEPRFKTPRRHETNKNWKRQKNTQHWTAFTAWNGTVLLLLLGHTRTQSTPHRTYSSHIAYTLHLIIVAFAPMVRACVSQVFRFSAIQFGMGMTVSVCLGDYRRYDSRTTNDRCQQNAHTKVFLFSFSKQQKWLNRRSHSSSKQFEAWRRAYTHKREFFNVHHYCPSRSTSSQLNGIDCVCVFVLFIIWIYCCCCRCCCRNLLASMETGDVEKKNLVNYSEYERLTNDSTKKREERAAQCWF